MTATFLLLSAIEPVNNGLSMSDYVSGFALLVSVVVLCKDIWHKHQERKASVNDLFWFREVAYPLTIKPIIESLNEMKSLLPDEASENYFDKNAQSKTKEITLNLLKLRRMYMAYAATLLTDNKDKKEELYSKLDKYLIDLEEHITKYGYENSQSLVSSKYCHNKNWIETKIHDAIQSIIKDMKNLQKS